MVVSSHTLFEHARTLIPGGVNSPVRAGKSVDVIPPFIAAADGCHIRDVEGNDYLVQVLEGLKADEEIVLSGQFLLDSESRLQEAIQKMLSARQGGGATETGAEDDLDMSDMTMESESGGTGDNLDMETGDDLNMDDLTMEPATE